MSNLTGRTEENVMKAVEGDPVKFQKAVNVPGMPQFNRTRDLANQTADELDQEETTRAAADAANADADTARAQAQATKDTAQDTALSQNAAADAATKTAQTAKDAAQDQKNTSQDQAIADNATADTTRATAQGAKDSAQDTAITQGDAATAAKIPASEILSGTVPATTNNGSFTFTFPAAYKTPPFVDGRQTWSADTMITPAVSNITATGCTVIVKRSRGTLLLTSGPFETAPSGTVFSLNVTGVKA